jgi:hypothetical protein
MRTYNEARNDLLAELRKRGFSISQDAMKPLQRINFTKLVAIHDHEEHFLFTVLVDSLAALLRARGAAGAAANKITAEDVESALLMVGAAAARQPEQTLSKVTRGVIKDACPWC